MMKHETIHLNLDGIGQRLDALLSQYLPDISRAQIQNWIKDGLVQSVDGKPITQASLKLKAPLDVVVLRPIKKPFEPPKPEDMPDDLVIVFEDEHLLVVNKPIGLAVHPGAGRKQGTLVNILLGHTGGQLSDMGDQERPGIVHRLDKDTSGLMLIAKTNRVHAKLADALKAREVKRIYQAIVYGVPNPREGTVHTFIGRDPRSRQRMAVLESGGKDAVTHFEIIKLFGLDFSIVRCELETGRTHQIRVHMAHLGHPLLGDPIYTGRRGRKLRRYSPEVEEAIRALPGQALHAGEIRFQHPITGEDLVFTAEPPESFLKLEHALGVK